MSSHILDPLRLIARRLKPKPGPDPRLIAALTEGLDLPEHLIGRDVDLLDANGRLVATTRRPVDPTVAGMLG